MTTSSTGTATTTTAEASIASRLAAVIALVAGLLVVGVAFRDHPARSARADLQAVVPARLFESRVGESTVDGVLAGGGRVVAGSVTEVVVAGRGGVDDDASAVVLNVTAVGPSGAGFLTVFPCGSVVPEASNVNYSAGGVVANAVVAGVGVGGSVCVFSLVETDLVVDVNGFVPAGGSPEGVVPARLFESRVGESTVDGVLAGGGRVVAGSVTEVVVAGRGGVDDDASAVVLNVTAVGPSGAGFLTVFPCGSVVPEASNVNYSAGGVVANAVVAGVGVGGSVCVFSLVETDLVVDVNGFVPAGGSPEGVVPARLFESRVGESTVDGVLAGGGRVAAGSVTEVVVAGRGGVDDDASAVVLNVTAVGPSGAGFLTVFPCGSVVPEASNVNYSAGGVVANAVVAGVGVGGSVCVFSLVETDLVVDVNGFVPARPTPTTTSTTPGATTSTVPTTAGPTSSSTTSTTSTTTSSSTSTSSTTSTTSTTTSSTSSTSTSSTTSTVPNPVDTLVPPSTTLPPPTSPTSGTFEFLTTYTFGAQTEAARWNPCEPIRYVVNADRATPAQIALMNQAIATVEQATALDFVFVGVTLEGLDLQVPGGSGADAVLVFSDETATPGLAGSTIGLGGSFSSAWVDGGGVLWAQHSAGGAMVDVDASDGIQERVWMHELGHMLGLDHVNDSSELMYFSLGSQSGFGPGDLEGLWNLGAAQPCIPDEPFAATSRAPGGTVLDLPTGDADW